MIKLQPDNPYINISRNEKQKILNDIHNSTFQTAISISTFKTNEQTLEELCSGTTDDFKQLFGDDIFNVADNIDIFSEIDVEQNTNNIKGLFG